MYWDIKKLSVHLNIKLSTLYAWVAEGKIPHFKIHGLIRFKPEEIEQWLQPYHKTGLTRPSEPISRPSNGDPIDTLIERVRREVYNGHKRETRPRQGRKEAKDGSV